MNITPTMEAKYKACNLPNVKMAASSVRSRPGKSSVVNVVMRIMTECTLK